MYINPFLAGVIATLLIEVVACIIYALSTGGDRK